MEQIKRTPHEPNATAYRRTGKNEQAYEHIDRRHKITLRDFRAARWLELQTAGRLYTFEVGRSQFTWLTGGAIDPKSGNCYTSKHWPRRHKNAKRIKPPKPTPIAYLMSSPLDMERLDLRAQVRGDAKKLASKAAKFLTLHAEYAERRTFAKRRHIIEPLKLPNPVTRQLPCVPFESGKNCLPGMQAWLDRQSETEYAEAA